MRTNERVCTREKKEKKKKQRKKERKKKHIVIPESYQLFNHVIHGTAFFAIYIPLSVASRSITLLIDVKLFKVPVDD